MAQYPPGIRVAQAVGLTGAAYLAGNIASFTLASVPALQTAHTRYQAPLTLIVKQWRDMYEAGHAQNPPIAILAASSFAFLAWSVHRDVAVGALAPRNASTLYALAAALTVGIVPWTFATMMGTNRLLLERAGNAAWAPSGEKGEEEEREVTGALARWRTLNGVRALLPLLGVVAGVCAF
ncbi:hypothetical protein ASPVEDRAFT_24878 [Aspergillus versicolor CBS 583.65]|uniref:DUF1772 domain-containing protein n=1 Tax=Aspergillus versicolor CBS 583.65 TaxID=1036611 RepID=A0A1L9P948_ASPVE|nr:uncharacterized protein ASPVEDRAFT_24878 [Aspergillus versicolor CBS 583.65]OJI97964.1 hypothetical protein ASPVEDRAFT_24878 [Aspergillus versicolor CBS 583.65]